ncbi:MAG: hypothetical protein H8E98_05715 [Bacteroidetes bacterium]|nr:hypothetical protein [Bacteroidota bacterium]
MRKKQENVYDAVDEMKRNRYTYLGFRRQNISRKLYHNNSRSTRNDIIISNTTNPNPKKVKITKIPPVPNIQYQSQFGTYDGEATGYTLVMQDKAKQRG